MQEQPTNPKRKKDKKLIVEHDHTFVKHPTSFKTHPTKPRKENDGPIS